MSLQPTKNSRVHAWISGSLSAGLVAITRTILKVCSLSFFSFKWCLASELFFLLLVNSFIPTFFLSLIDRKVYSLCKFSNVISVMSFIKFHWWSYERMPFALKYRIMHVWWKLMQGTKTNSFQGPLFQSFSWWSKMILGKFCES